MNSLRDIAKGRGIPVQIEQTPAKSLQQLVAENAGEFKTVLSESTRTVKFPTRAEREAAEKAKAEGDGI